MLRCNFPIAVPVNFLDKMLAPHAQRHHLARDFAHHTATSMHARRNSIRDLSENTRMSYLQQASLFA